MPHRNFVAEIPQLRLTGIIWNNQELTGFNQNFPDIKELQKKLNMII